MDNEEAIRGYIEQERRSCNVQEAYRTVFGMLDVTTLEGTDNEESIRRLCREVLSYKDEGSTGNLTVAAVCVYPVFAHVAATELKGSGVRTACVAGGFPSGQMPLPVRLAEVEYALDEGAQEIDMVISRGKLLAGDETYIRKEVGSFAGICKGRALLKVILETGELKEETLIRRAGRIAMEEGADFLKTSTGKVQPGATLDAFFLMLDEIRAFHAETGIRRGIKAAGGIRDVATALDFYLLTAAILGQSWLDSDHLRFGASRLTGELHRMIIQP